MNTHSHDSEYTLEQFLKEEGIYEEVAAAAAKRVLAWQVEQAMNDHGLTKTAMAKRMRTSRAALNRLLDPESTSMTLIRVLVKAPATRLFSA